MNYIETIDNSINLFLDITTVCNLNCSYCFARKEKEWERIQTLEHIKYILKCLNLSKYNFNILLFGGEALLHPNIKEIVELCNLHKKVLNTVILTNGVLQGNYELDAIYVFSLHSINEKEYDKFKEHCKIPKQLKINMVLNESEIFKKRYLELSSDYQIEISQVYDKNVKIIKDLSDMDFLIFKDKKYKFKDKYYSYDDYLKIHFNLVPKEFGICRVQELNITIDGVISNDCNNTNDNIFDNPLFFKNYNNEFNCQRDRCMDCTGTIRTSKEI